ncbi:hypothetical protein NDU88_009398 [Pleurodeles waltl]|uniref:Uncharacterized protein n=1 Tax=Pleurodeles waltl TaxID=8319 RepID=A0AAV7PSM7_PLEWA|nr:hypothetical protein NDU88_009398 [Pleurodeles waltl]
MLHRGTGPAAATLAGLPQLRPGLICWFVPVKKISEKETKSEGKKLTGTFQPAYQRRAPWTSDQGLPRSKDFHLKKTTKSEGKNLHRGLPRSVSGEGLQEVGLEWQVPPLKKIFEKETKGVILTSAVKGAYRRSEDRHNTAAAAVNCHGHSDPQLANRQKPDINKSPPHQRSAKNWR